LRESNAGLREDIATGLEEVRRLKAEIEAIGDLPKPKPVKLEPFWAIDYNGSEKPPSIQQHHWDEWVESAVHPSVIAARLQSIDGNEVIERLIGKKLEYLSTHESDGKLKKIRSQSLTQSIKKKTNYDEYDRLAQEGGWFVDAGIDPLGFADGAIVMSDYGTFKPDSPRIDEEKTERKRRIDPEAPPQVRKYENPMGIKVDLFERSMAFGLVPDEIAQKIFERYGVIQTPEEKEMGFWYTVWKHPEIPIYRVEGDKKDAALVSQGRVVISGQGVNAGYRAKDQFGNKLPERVLHPQLRMFCHPDREIRYAFDSDTKTTTICNVRQEMVREGELMESEGCKIVVIRWESSLGKGVDDLINQSGPRAWEKADANPIPFAKEKQAHYRWSYNKLLKGARKNGVDRADWDKHIYIQAALKGELADAERFLMESDRARALPESEKAAYIQSIKDSVPEYLQRRQARERERDRVAVKKIPTPMRLLKENNLEYIHEN
jgi:hypothetical protein